VHFVTIACVAVAYLHYYIDKLCSCVARNDRSL